MAQTHFVQIPCAKCGTTVWIAPAAGVGYCPSCHTPNQLPPGAAAGAAAAPAAGYGAPAAGYGAPAAGYGAPAGGAPQYGAPAGGAPAGMPYAAQAPAGMTGVAMKPPGFPVLKIVGAIGLAIVVGGISIGGNYLRNRFKPGKASTSTYGIDSKKAEPDKMIGAAGTLARKWRSDAVFWKMNISQMGADGTVDLNKTNVVIEYFSPSGVSASVAKLREDSIKKFNFVNGTDILYADRYSPTGRGWNPPPPATPMPACNTKMLAAKLAAKGVTGSKTVQVTLDPESGKGPAWVVQMDGGPQYFDLNTCNQK